MATRLRSTQGVAARGRVLAAAGDRRLGLGTQVLEVAGNRDQPSVLTVESAATVFAVARG